MGGGTYNTTSRTERATSAGYYSRPAYEIFRETKINNEMNPRNVKIRESRDSKEHPNSLPIIIALDVTGSMGSIPHHLVKDGLPNIMSSVIQKGMPDPQLLFLGVGDHEYDSAPLQVAQFESNDEMLDKWLTTVYLEGGGGGNEGESYFLAWYFAAFRTATDSFEKRNNKGYLFTIGDEPTLSGIKKGKLKEIMGHGQYEDYSTSFLLEKAKEKYNVYHIHLMQGSNGTRTDVIDGWKQLMGNNLIVMQDYSNLSKIISDTITSKKNEASGQTLKPNNEEIL